MRRLNPTVLALLGGLVILLLIIAYFATNRNSDQDKLTGNLVGEAAPASPDKRCATQATYDLIKRDLFRRAAQLRGSDRAAFDKLANYAVLRMDNPVMENEDGTTGAIHCSGSLSLDLPPGVAVVGGRHNLTSDVDYAIQPAADASGDVVLLSNADAIIASLATLARVSEPGPPAVGNETASEQTEENVAGSESVAVQPGPATAYPGRPSFDCASARTRGEIAVCSDSGLSALDLNMATQYRRALTTATPQQRQILQTTRDHFLAYRDRCPSRSCMSDAYVGRMREVRDIMEGRWLSPR